MQPRGDRLIAALPTEYRGTRFRSKLEAQWAAFFDALKIGWWPEPGGFTFALGECYRPDFKIQIGQHCYWFEVKGEQPPGDLRFYGAFAVATERDLILAIGDLPRVDEIVRPIYYPRMMLRIFDRFVFPERSWWSADGYAPLDSAIWECYRCGAAVLGGEYAGRIGVKACQCNGMTPVIVPKKALQAFHSVRGWEPKSA